jgi:DNA-binding NarL/FixJ family response regulator
MRVLDVVVIDDHPLMREVVRAMLACAADIQVVGEADSAERGLEVVGRTRPDIVVLDLGLPRMSGLVCLDRLRAEHPGVSVVVLSAEDDPHTIEVALRRGARAFVRKNVNPDDLPAVLRHVVEETVFHASSLPAGGPGSAAQAAGLSPKELDVLEQITQGRSNKQISEALWITQDTVKFHLRHIYKKLGVGSRTEALRAAHDRALVVSAPALDA